MPRQGKINRSGTAAILSLEELALLLYELDDPHKAIVQICYICAARIGETLSLEAEHIRGGYIWFTAARTKTRKTRSVILTQPLIKVLKRLPTQNFLFPSSGRSGHLTARAVEYQVKNAARLVDFEGVSLHSFRRSRLTHLYEQGWALNELMRVSGHETLSGLQHYLGVEQGTVDKKLREFDRHLSLEEIT